MILKCFLELTLLNQSQYIVTRGSELRKEVNYETAVVLW